jgi:glycosyltransferase involved in cell wall biosynthesis
VYESSPPGSGGNGASPGPHRPTVTILIPAYNEAAAIGGVIASVQRVRETLAHPSELLVIDDGSEDDTGRIAVQGGATLITHAVNRGKGAALKTGIEAARGETVIVVDADGQHDPSDIGRLLAFRPAFEMVMGDRGRGGGASPLWRTPGKAVLGLIAQVLVGRKIPDLNCGLRAVDRQTALRMLPILPNGFSFETTLTVAMLKAGYPTTWVPIQVAPRIGRSTVRVADGFNMLLLIVRLVSLFSPLRVFLPISGLMLAIGIWYMVESYLLFQAASIKALLAMLASLLFFLFGLLADQIAALRRGEAVLRSGERIAPVPGVAFDRGWRPARSEAPVEPAVAPADAVDPTLGKPV